MAIERKTQVTGFGAAASTAPLTGFSSTAPTGEDAFNNATAAFKEDLSKGAGDFVNIFAQNTSGPLGRQGGTVRLNDLYERADRVVSKVNSSEIKLSVIKLDHQEHSLYVPAIVLVGRNLGVTNGKVFAYAMLLEQEQTAEPEVRSQNGYKIIIPVVTGTAWDSKYAEAVKRHVAVTCGVKQEEVVAFSACVVPKDLDFSAPDQNSVNPNLTNLLANAGFAVNTKLTEERGLPIFRLQGSAPNEVMVVEPKFSRNLKKNLVGREMRADIELTFSLKQQQQKNHSLNGGENASRVFGTMTGYIDFLSVINENQPGAWGNQAQVVNKSSPLFVITSMFTAQAGSIHGQLTMLMSAATMAANDEWVNSLYERHLASKRSGEALDIGEVGGLNIEANLPIYRPKEATGMNQAFGPIIDTRVADFDRARYIGLVQQLCHQDMFIAIDAPNVGAESWYTDLFRASSLNNEIGRWSTQRIFQALQELTNNKFAIHFQALTRNTQLWISEPVTIHNGYYISRNGNERRDIRDIDQLAINNCLGATDPLACARWASTFMPGVDQERALTERKEMIEQICGGSNNVVYTGYSTRLFLNPAVIKAMMMCAAEAKFNMRFASAYQTGLGNFNNHAFNFGGASGLNSTNVGSTFRGGFGGGNQGIVMGNSNFFSEGGLKF